MVKNSTQIEISLTDFIDFVAKTGNAKMTKVKEVKHRDAYSPATDFYKPLREGIIANHQNGGNRNELKKIIVALKDPKKFIHYTDAVLGYEKFWGRKKMQWFTPPTQHWRIGDLKVRVNPELGLICDGQSFIVKLYFKDENAQKGRVDQILTLMEKELRSHTKKETRMAVLDVKRGKLFIKDNNDISLLPLLEGEANSFVTIWKGI